MTARIIQLLGVVIVGDFSLRLAGRDLERSRLHFFARLVDGFGHFRANRVQVRQVRGEAALAVGKAVTIRRAVGVRRADQNVFRRNPSRLGAHFVSQHRRKTEEVGGDNRHPRLTSLQDQSPDREVSFLSGDRVRRSNASRHGQQGVGRHHPHSNTRPELSRREAAIEGKAEKKPIHQGRADDIP